MTFKEKLTQMLFERGMSENSAAEILEATKNSDGLKNILIRWNDNIDDYPDIMVPALWLHVKSEALLWIDANCPKAWNRPLFEETP